MKERKLQKAEASATIIFKVFRISRNPATEDGLGIALTLKTVTDELLKDAKVHRNLKPATVKRSKLPFKTSGSASIPNLTTVIANQTECSACGHISTMMQTYIQDFLHSLNADEGFLKLYDESAGLCNPHYSAVLFIASRMCDTKSALSARRIVEKQIQALEKVQRDLSDYIEKQDYHFSEKEKIETEGFLSENLARVVGRQGAERTLETILKTK